MGKVYVTRCPLCGFAQRYSEDRFTSENAFPEREMDDFIRVQEVGGKVAGSNPRGRGRGSAKGKVETMESYPIDEVPGEYEDFLEKMKERIEKVLERMEE